MINLPSLGYYLNIFIYYVAITVMWIMFKPTIDKMRLAVGLKRITWYGVKNLFTGESHHTWSPILHPKPKDWPASTNVGGFMFYDNPSDALKPDLETFLNEGTAPIYVGFGSMPIHLSTNFVPLVKELLETLPTSHRIIVYAGGMSNATNSDATRGELKNQLLQQDPSRKRLFVTYSVPQRLLFPRCIVIVHHGGSGTTGEALRSGKPSIICPLIGDQHFWARRVALIGCGPRIGCSFASMTGEKLGLKVQEAMKEEYVVRAKEIGLKVQQEKGLENAVAFVLKHVRESVNERRSSYSASKKEE
ncbi:UNVERIFIED_CONTAM: hypothetical protein HDU68_006054 [Siphonaria sp. JEL0065]|nr:hypothetical protein HDU68_006054 [Siphonaria sp. JEL0065]